MISNGTDNGMIMPVAPMYGGNYGNCGNGFCGDWNSWIILFLIFGMFGNNGWGWGNGGNGNGNGTPNPWLLAANQRTDDNVQAGFNQAALSAQLGDIQSAITSGFSNAEVSGCNRALTQLQTEYQNQIASMNQRFSDATANAAQLNSLAMGLQNCCCENRASVADLKYTVATEACADRNTVNMGVRDLLTSNTANTQAVLDAIRGINDKLCEQELMAERRENDNLRQQLNMASLAASQTSQTAAITAGQRALANEIEQYVRPVVNPAYVVPNPNCCNQNYACCGVA